MNPKKLFYSGLFFLGYLINCQLSSAQTTPHLTTVVPPSPDVQAMQKYGDIPISAYTGVPSISIPLYTIKSHDITLPITISYHASGIKVSEEASQVGLGWALNAGGMISRKISNADDFIDGVYFNNLMNTAKDLTNAYAPVSPIMNGATYNNGFPNAVDCTGPLESSTKNDFEPDEFYYNLPGGASGKFLMKRDYTAVLEKQERVDIICITTPSTGKKDGQTWQVITADGFKYDFTKAEYYLDLDADTYHHITTSYLTQITSPTGKIMTFNYQQNGIVENVKMASSFTEVRNEVNPPIEYGYIPQILPLVKKETPSKAYTCFSLQSIDYDGGRIVFTNTSGRQDVTDVQRLDAVQVYTKDAQGNLSASPVKVLTFGYDYFNGQNAGIPGSWFSSSNTGSGNTVWNYRLKLTSLTESGQYNGQMVTQSPYLFTYYQQSTGSVDLPSKDSFSIDHWGYYNGKYTNTSFIPNFTRAGTFGTPAYWYGYRDDARESNGTFMPAFSLKQIKYPEGGTTTFEYENNDCDEAKSLINDNTVNPYPYTVLQSSQSPFSHGWPVGATESVLLDMSDKITGVSGELQGTLSVAFRTNTAVTPDGPDIAYLSVVNNATGAETRLDPYYYEIYRTIGSGAITLNMPNTFPVGKYTIKLVINNTGYGTQLFGGVASFNWMTQVTSAPDPSVTHPITFFPSGGLRIKRITDDDNINPPKVRKYVYHYTLNGNEFSYGRTMTRPNYTYWEVSEDIVTVHTGSGNAQTPYLPLHLMRSSNSNIALNGSAAGSPVGYDQVTELYGENGENGKSIYYYHNNPDYVSPYQYVDYDQQRPYNSTVKDPLNGSLLEQADYKFEGGQYVMVKDVVNNYVYKSDSTKYIYAFEDHLLPHYAVDFPEDGPETVSGPTYYPKNSDDRLLKTYSPIQSVWTYLASTDEKLYSTIDPTKYQETITNYTYSPKHYLPISSSFINSKGQVVTTNTTYPLDYAPTSTTDIIAKGIKNLLTSHVYTAPIEKSTTRTDITGANPATVAASLTVYDANTPQPSQLYQMESVSPIASFAHLGSTGLSTSIDASYKPAIAFTYDATTGKLLVQAKNLDMNNGYLWGGQNKLYPIAECKNATNTEFYYQGYEDLTTGVVTGSAHTGNKYTANTSVSWTRPNGRSYVISYWKRTGSGPWIYSGEIAYTGSSYTMTGGDSYDDVRIYPNDAQMSTYTYAPMTGITSVTDMKGLTTYFEYDGLQRLMNVKDKDGNIVKNYKYNLQH